MRKRSPRPETGNRRPDTAAPKVGLIHIDPASMLESGFARDLMTDQVR